MDFPRARDRRLAPGFNSGARTGNVQAQDDPIYRHLFVGEWDL